MMKRWSYPPVLLLLLLASFWLQAQPPDLKPSLLPWHDQFRIENMIFSADGRYLLTVGDDKTLIISDLKKRIQLTRISYVLPRVLVAHASLPFFYTLADRKDSLVVQKRELPSGRIIQLVPLTGGISAYSISSENYFITVDPENEIFILSHSDGPVNSSSGRQTRAIEFDSRGIIKREYTGLGDQAAIAGAWYRNEFYLATSKAVWKQNGDKLEKIISAGDKEFFANMKRSGDMLVVLSDQVRWIDLHTMKALSGFSIAQFFSSNPNDNTALTLRQGHPFVVDEKNAVWITNTKMQDRDSDHRGRKSYYVARIDPKGISYPLLSNSSGLSIEEYKNTDPVIAYSPATGQFALMENTLTNAIGIVDRNAGLQFTLERKNVRLERFHFTSTPGKLLVRFYSSKKDGVFIRLGNGKLETVDLLDDRTIAWHNTHAYPGNENRYLPMTTGEKFYEPSRKQFRQSWYWHLKDETILSVPQDTCRVVTGNTITELNSEEGVLKWRTGEKEKTQAIKDPEGKPVNQDWVFGNYKYDSASSLLTLYWSGKRTFSKYIQVINCATQKIIRSWKTGDMLVLPGGTEFVNEGRGIFRMADSSLVEAFPDECFNANNYLVSRDGRYITFYKDNIFNPDEIMVWDRQRKKLSVAGTQQSIGQMEADPFSNLIYTLGKDESIRIWDPAQAKQVAQLVFNAKQGELTPVREQRPGYLVLLPDGNYMGENKYYEMLSMRNGETEYPVFQMDAKFHRPDKVLSALGYADSSLVKAIGTISEKRAARFTAANTQADVFIREKQKLPYYTTQKIMPLSIGLSGRPLNAKGIMLYVNGTALWPSPGKPLSVFTSGEQFETRIDLVDPVNHIRVCLVDESGKETPGDYAYINAAAETKRNLYFVGLGISHYRDSKNNLQYAAKDMEDISGYFKTVSSYEKVYACNLRDSQVTKKSLDSISSFLSSAASSDQVVVYFAGHGLLDTKSGNYYLSTYDWQTADPGSTGLFIDDLNKAIAGSPARKKILMIDACNSGLQADAVTTTGYTDPEKEKSVVARGLIVSGASQNAAVVGFAFNHFNQGNGVDILAASAGNEFAFETDSLKNGLFTYSLLSAFKSGDADLDKDGNLSVSELQLYVSSMVSKLSKGKQQPSFRQANLYQDVAMLSRGDSYFENMLVAAKSDYIPTLKICVEKEKVPVDKKDGNGFTALLYACRNGSLNAVKYLLDKGADINARSNLGFTALYLAAYNREEKIVYLLLDKGVKVQEQIDRAWLADTVKARATKLIAEMLADFPSVKAREERQYAFARFLLNEQLPSADSLYNSGNINIDHWQLMDGINPLFVTIFQKKHKSIEWLLQKKVNVNYTNASINGITPLMAAVYAKDTATVQLLLDHGADKKAKTTDGRTALSIAQQDNSTEMIALLSK